jgi:hypothetical protein
MSWTTPTLTEVKMDAEIGSYQPDDDPRPFSQPLADSEDESAAE